MKKNLFKTLLGLLIISLVGLNTKTAQTRVFFSPHPRLHDIPPCDRGCEHRRGMNKYRPIQNFSGEITIISFPMAMLQTREEKLYLNLGPVWYWKKHKYRLKSGEEVKIRGYRWGRYILPITIFTPKGKIRLRDMHGFPMWRKIRDWEKRGWGCPY